MCKCVKGKRQINANNDLNSVCLSKYPLGDEAVTVTSHAGRQKSACVSHVFCLHKQRIIQEYSLGKPVTYSG